MARHKEEVLEEVFVAQRVHRHDGEALRESERQPERVSEKHRFWRDVEYQVFVEGEYLGRAFVRIEQLVHRGLVKPVSALNRRIVLPAVRRILDDFELRFAADFRANG